jgi:hypothetical protein
MRIGDVANTKPSDRYTHNMIHGIPSMFGMCFAIRGRATNTAPTVIRSTPSTVKGRKSSIVRPVSTMRPRTLNSCPQAFLKRQAAREASRLKERARKTEPAIVNTHEPRAEATRPYKWVNETGIAPCAIYARACCNAERKKRRDPQTKETR